MAGDVTGGGRKASQKDFASQSATHSSQRRFLIQRGHAFQVPAAYQPDAALPDSADVAEHHPEPQPQIPRGNHTVKPMLRVSAKPREVEVRNLDAERAGRVFPCMQDGNHYTGCIGFDQCTVLCWSPRPREREAVVRVEQRTGGPCRDCIYAREVRGEVATLNGRQVRLMECRLGYWHGRTTLTDFVMNRIALNVVLPCPGFDEADMPHPAVARMREVARRRRSEARQEEQPIE